MKPSAVVALCLGATALGAFAGYFVFRYVESERQPQQQPIITSLFNSEEKTNLLHASLVGDKKTIERLINQDTDLNVKDNDGKTPLFFAIASNSTNIVKILLANGADMTIEDNNGNTPLSLASKLGNKEIIDILAAKSSKHQPKTISFENTANSQVDKDANSTDKHPQNADLTPLKPEIVENSTNYDSENNTKPFTQPEKDDKLLTIIQPEKDDSLAFNWKNALEQAVIQNDEKAVALLIQKYVGVPSSLEEPWPLHVAVQMRRTNIVKILINMGININLKDNNGFSAIHWAAFTAGDGEIIELLLESGKVDVNQRDNNNFTALHWAAAQDHAIAVEILLDCGVDVELVNNLQLTPLQLAVQNNHERVIKVFKNKFGIDWLLQKAITYGYTEIAKSCIESESVDLNARNEKGLAPIHLASREGLDAVIKALLKHGDDVNRRDSFNWTALSWASFKDQPKSVQLLLNFGADINMAGNFSWTPLDWATYMGCKKVVQVFKKHFGFVKLITWASENNHRQALKSLIREESYENIECATQGPPLHWAVKNGYAAIVELLIEKRIDIDLKDKSGNTALYYAVQNGNEIILKILLDADADVNAVTSMGDSGLHLATCYSRKNIIKILLDYKTNVNLKDSKGWTPLHWAAFRQNEEIVDMLLKKGGDINIKNNDGQTARDFARRSISITKLMDSTKSA